MNILPGSRAVNKTDIPRCNAELKQGLVLMNGSLPESHLNPGMHHFAHTGQYTKSHGLLTILWMMGFERSGNLVVCSYLF